MDNDKNKRFRKISIYILIVITLLFTLSRFVFSVDVWDRPVYSVNYTPEFLNVSNQINNLQSQLNNETYNRIVNDTYLNQSIYVLSFNLANNYYTKIQSDNKYYLNTNPAGYINTSIADTLYYPLLTNPAGYINSSQLNQSIFELNNSIYIDIDYLFNFSYDINYTLTYISGLISIMNQTINDITHSLNYTNQSLYMFMNYTNYTMQQINSTIKQPTGKYLSYNSSNFYVNESMLNITINNISENKKYLYIDTINVINGTGYFTSNYSIEYLLTRITINGLGIFRSECIEFTNNTIIDKNRIPHIVYWDIEKNYAINDKINCTITNANINGMYNITLTYINNGLY